jgi:hypothetical protein
MGMFLLAFALAATPLPGQVFAGPSFEAFARQTERSCPARQLRLVTPAALDWEQERFQEQLSPKLSKQLAAANRQERHCAGRNGLSCPTVETLNAMVRTRLLRPFVAFACSHQQP